MDLTRRDTLAGTTLALAGSTTPLSVTDRGVPASHRIAGTARIGFVGDVMLGRDVEATHDDPEGVWDGFLDRLRSLDGLVGNLECALTARGEARPEKTFCFRAAPAFGTAALDVAGVSAVTLANNHSMDFGPVSLRDTTRSLAAAEIAHAGAGRDREAAFAPTTVQAGDVTVAVVGLTDRYSAFAAGPDSAGTAWVDLDVSDPGTRRRVARSLSRIPVDVDVVVASLHWGPNYEPKTDDHRRFARWLIGRGVDVVHGHSAHEIAGIEVYRGRPILYDTGNFVEDFAPVEGHYNGRSFLFELVVDDGLEALRLHPAEIVDESVRPAGPEVRGWLHDRIRDRSTRYGTEVVGASDGAALRVSLD